MPGSDSNQIPAILRLVSEVQPSSILDVGVGWGKYGALFRMTLEGGYANLSDRQNWKLRIDGVEAFPEYIGSIQKSFYNHIYLGDIRQQLAQLEFYDVVFMGDVLEHFPHAQGMETLRCLLQKTRRRLIVSTPNGPYAQGEMFGNPYERHQSHWTPDDFGGIAHAEVYADKKSIIAVLSNEPIAALGRRWRIGGYARQPWSAAIKARLHYRWRRWVSS